MMIKDFVKKICVDLSFGLYQRGILKMSHPIDVMSIEDTIAELANSDKSLVRFGDGELVMMKGKGIHFQNSDEKLAEDLRRIIQLDEPGLMVAIQDIFGTLQLYRKESQDFWKEHLLFYRKYYEQYCRAGKKYAAAYFSRCYITMGDKSKCDKWFASIREIWKDKDVILIEGATTHNGVGNDLFSGCRSVKRIICPSVNAYGKLDKIKEECMKQDPKSLFLVSLGPTAKPLVEYLYFNNRRAIDIGQIDFEYEMFLAGATKKLHLPKHDLLTEEDNRKKGLDKYLDEIVVKID